MRHEAIFTTKFVRWLSHSWPKSSNFEVKICTGVSIPFSDVKDHQLHALKTAARASITYKIPDDSRSQKPFDCFKQVGVDGYIVLYWVRRANKKFYIIDIDTWTTQKETSKKKSLRESEAEAIAYLVGELK